MTIENREVGLGNPMYIIVEIAQAHDGSLGFAHAFIDAVARTGADAIKFQTHIAQYESSHEDQWRIPFSYEDATRYDYWRRMEFSSEQWCGLKKHAEERGLTFLSSPFSVEAAMLLDKLDVLAWKIASGEVTNDFLMDYLITTKKPFIVSNGLSTEAEMASLFDKLKKNGCPYALMHCVTEYPAQAQHIDLSVIPSLKARYDCPVGFSDHSSSIYTGLALAAIHGDLLEIHATMSKDMFGPDVCASLTIEEIRQMTEGIRYIEKLVAPKDQPSQCFTQNRLLFLKSLAYRRNMKKGDVIKYEDLMLLKPGTGIQASQKERIIGKAILCDVAEGSFVDISHISG